MTTERDIQRAWAWVHNESDAPERKAVEEESRTRAELQADIAAAQRVDHALRVLMPLVDWPPTELERRILDSMGVQPARAPAAKEPARPRLRVRPARLDGHGTRWIRFPLAAVTAVAASVLLLLGWSYRRDNGVVWSRPEFAQCAYRGVGRAPYTLEDAAVCLTALKRAVFAEIRTTPIAPDARWTLAFRFQDEADGGLLIRVAAAGPDRQPAASWQRMCRSTADFVNQAEAFAQTIVRELRHANKPN